MFSHNGYAEAFVTMTLEPFIRDMEAGEKDRTVEVPLNNLFRQVGCWKYRYSSLPRHDCLFGYDPGIPEVEAKAVYMAMDHAFQQVFPDLIGYFREEAAEVMENLASSVYCEIFKGGPAIPDHKEQLITFAKELVKILKSEKIKTPVMSESAV